MTLELKEKTASATKIIVNMADAGVSNNSGDMLITYSLGSCVGVTIYDPVEKVGGMIHCMLPLSKVDKEKAAQKPYMFVDSGMSLFLQALYELGLKKSRAVVKVCGCSEILDKSGVFRIGERNHTILRKLLWKNGLMVESEDVGGQKSRTLKLFLDTGLVTISSQGTEVEL